MKRWTFWLASAGMAAALLVGCGGDDDESPPVNTAGKPSTGGSAGSTGAGGGKSGGGGTSAMAGGGGQASAQIEIEGTWINSIYGEKDVIDDTTWSSSFGDSAPTVSDIVEFSNSERYAIRKAPNDATAFYPGTFDRVVWTKPAGDVIYYCTVIYGCPSADLTETGAAAGGAGSAGAGGAGDEGVCQLSVVDDTDPEHGGCGGFEWTKLTRQ